MTVEKRWSEPDLDETPEDLVIVDSGIGFWDSEWAEGFGFSGLIPEDSTATYYVALGMNAIGEVVGAKLLSNTPVPDRNKVEPWLLRRHEDALEDKARKIFGLV